MAIHTYLLDAKGRIALPGEWRAGREQAVLMLQPDGMLAVMGTEQYERAASQANPEQQRALSALSQRVNIDRLTGRIQVPLVYRQACGLQRGDELVCVDWPGKHGVHLRILPGTAWDRERLRLEAIARQPDFPVPTVPAELRQMAEAW